MTITQARMESELEALASTDEEYAEAKTQVARLEIERARARKRAFILATGTVAERQAIAEDAPEVINADIAFIKATAAYERLKARRQTGVLVVDTWRTVESSRRRGNA